MRRTSLYTANLQIHLSEITLLKNSFLMSQYFLQIHKTWNVSFTEPEERDKQTLSASDVPHIPTSTVWGWIPNLNCANNERLYEEYLDLSNRAVQSQIYTNHVYRSSYRGCQLLRWEKILCLHLHVRCIQGLRSGTLWQAFDSLWSRKLLATVIRVSLKM